MNTKIANRQCGLRREYAGDQRAPSGGERTIQLAPSRFVVHLLQFDCQSTNGDQIVQTLNIADGEHDEDSPQLVCSAS